MTLLKYGKKQRELKKYFPTQHLKRKENETNGKRNGKNKGREREK